ncbi:hypothetical protein BV20DRAFT_1028094 [Pilatotrama ljubarskyi]|nr:hypothetical protein BV20DRAFT_1028094 [Pilatotrama ljubarskyi]
MAILTASQILDVARVTVDIFERRGLKSCLMGSVASYLYGVSRTPNDVDLVVLTTVYTQESLKEMLVQDNKQFTLVRSRNPRATYRVLWYRIPGTYQRCKVDILIPGILNVPVVPEEHIFTKAPHYLPMMPLIPQLLLKLQGWSDHRASPRSDMKFKQYVDVLDIDALLEIVCKRKLRIDDKDARWVPESMIVDALSTLRKYVLFASTGSVWNWRSIGFSISAERAIDF